MFSFRKLISVEPDNCLLAVVYPLTIPLIGWYFEKVTTAADVKPVLPEMTSKINDSLQQVRACNENKTSRHSAKHKT